MVECVEFNPFSRHAGDLGKSWFCDLSGHLAPQDASGVGEGLQNSLKEFLSITLIIRGDLHTIHKQSSTDVHDSSKKMRAVFQKFCSKNPMKYT